jgi:hypothetical protein
MKNIKKVFSNRRPIVPQKRSKSWTKLPSAKKLRKDFKNKKNG